MLVAIHPKLPMRHKATTKNFYTEKLGFILIDGADYSEYLMLQKDKIELHFFLHSTLDPLHNYGQVYIRTDNIKKLYQQLIDNNIDIHPKGALSLKPWGIMEFSLLDPDHNLITFGELV